MLPFESLCQNLAHLFILAKERSKATLASGATAETVQRLGHDVGKCDKLRRDSVILIHQVDIFFSLDQLRHESEANHSVCIIVLHLLGFSIPVKTSLFIFADKVLVKASKVSFLVVNGLQADIFGEPDQAFHDSGRLSQLFSTAPAALAKTSFHILTMDQILIDLDKQFASL